MNKENLRDLYNYLENISKDNIDKLFLYFILDKNNDDYVSPIFIDCMEGYMNDSKFKSYLLNKKLEQELENKNKTKSVKI